MHLEYTPRWEIALQGLSERDLSRISACLTPHVFSARAVLYEEGVSNSLIHVVKSGRVRTFYIDVNGRDFTTRVSGAGSLLGIISCMSGAPPETSVQALDKVSTLALNSRAFDTLLHEIPQLSLNLNRLLAAMYREQLMRRKRTGDAAAVRLGKTLCKLSVLDDGSDGWHAGEIRGLTQQDLANMVGSSRTWVSLMLGAFEAKGVLRKEPARIVILDMAGLEQIVTELQEKS